MSLGAATSGAIWGSATESCIVLHTEHGKISVFSTFASDLVLLALMLVGLLRWKNARQRCGIWWLLCTQVVISCQALDTCIMADVIPQGLIWVLLVTLAEVPPTVRLLTT
jgi:hypothetical protein